MAETPRKTAPKAAAAKPAAAAKAAAKPAKTVTPKAAAPAKTAAPAGARRTAAKTGSPSTGRPRAKTAVGTTVVVSDEQRYRMIAEAAYFRAESSQFQSDPVRDWIEAEKDIAALLNGHRAP